MKILQVITSLQVGGAEKLITQLAPMLRNRGHDVDVLLFDGTSTPLLENLKVTGIRIISLRIGGSVYDLRHIFKLRKIICNYDVVHAHNAAAQLFIAIASVACPVILCTTEHNTSNRRRNWWWYRPFDKWMYGCYARIICISEGVERSLRQNLKWKRDNLIVVYNGIDIQKYISAISSPLLKCISGENSKTLLMVAGFRYQKDQDTLIKAVALLPSHYHVFLVGDGERRADLEALICKLGVKDRVHLLGIRMDVPELLKAADIIVMSSHWGGFGLAAVEGMAARKPIIVSDVAGLGEIVRGYGLVFEPGNLDDLISKIKELEDAGYYFDVADRCMKKAQEFDISRMVDGYERIYKELMERGI